MTTIQRLHFFALIVLFAYMQNMEVIIACAYQGYLLFSNILILLSFVHAVNLKDNMKG